MHAFRGDFGWWATLEEILSHGICQTGAVRVPDDVRDGRVAIEFLVAYTYEQISVIQKTVEIPTLLLGKITNDLAELLQRCVGYLDTYKE